MSLEYPRTKSSVSLQENRYCLYPIQDDISFNYYKKAMSAFWTAEEIDLSKDVFNKLNEDEQYFIKNVLAFFASSDGLVTENLALRFLNENISLEAKLFYSFQMTIENIHSETYSLLIDTYIKESYEKQLLFQSINNNNFIKRKGEFCIKYINSEDGFIYRLIAFACVEGIFFSSSFCSIYWLKKRGLMPGLTFSNELISRDESLHTEFAIHLFKKYKKVNPGLNEKLIPEIIREGTELEKEFVRNSLQVNLIGMNSDNMCKYVEYCADRLLIQLGYDKIYKSENPFSFMEFISLTNKGNFFESKISQYNTASIANSLEGSKGFQLTDDF